MTYEETIKYLFEALPMYQRIGSAAYRADLDNAYELDKYSGYPHRAYKIIHVAGTNGKGSVSHMLAAVLQKAGYKTGLYTSPHLLDFRERIKVDGELIDKKYIIKYVQRNSCFFELIKPSFFEMSVFMAFSYFKTKEIDVAIVETGLGGRLDTTNIVSPIASVITNIGIDHIQFLGDSINKIAKEKAGIIKPLTPVVIGETVQESKRVFSARSELMESPITFAESEYVFEFATRTVDNKQNIRLHRGEELISYEIDLLGSYQHKNLSTCLSTLGVVKEKLPVSEENIKEGLANVSGLTGLLGRWQEVSYNPLTICDVAHNKEGFIEVLEQIKNTACKHLHMVLGFVKDKNFEDILSLLPKEATYYFTRASIERAASPAEIYCVAKNIGLTSRIFKDVESAYVEASNCAGSEDFIYVGGSTFVVADFLKFQKS
jgi:dihydrofolate synthase/folylpolyglutamate synthase